MVFNILKSIYNHPYNSQNKLDGIMRFIKWQINCRLNPYPIIYQFTQNSKLIISKGLTGVTGNLYCGLIEFDDMGFLLHLLRDKDLFIDIGANVGVYTILASSEVGANTIAIEPIPSTFKNLIENININQIQEKVKSLNIGLGSKKDIIRFTQSLDTVNHVATENEIDTIDVEVEKLDTITKNKKPLLIKMDVEGFETDVLNGSEEVLKSKDLKAIIIELNGSGERYGYDENQIHIKLLDHGFKPYKYNPKTRSIVQIEHFGKHNTIYIRDIEFVMNRVKTSRKIIVGGRKKI